MQKNDEFAKGLNHYLNRLERNSTWLADKLKIHPSTVSRWASGETRPGSMAIVTQLLDLLEVDNAHERLAFYQAAGFQAPPIPQPEPDWQQIPSANPLTESLYNPTPALNGQANKEINLTATEVSEPRPTARRAWRQRRTLTVVLVALAAFAAGPAACDTAQRFWVAPTATPAPPLTDAATPVPAPQSFTFNGPVAQFINQVENLTIFTGDPPEEKERKTAQRAALIAGEVRYYLATVDSRLGLVSTAVAEDTFGQQLAQTRATVAPALQEIAAAGYQTLIAAEQVNSLRQQLNSYPLPTQPSTSLLQLAGEGMIESTPLRFFYDQLGEVTWATESLIGVLSERAEESDARWQKYYAKSSAVAVALVKNRSALAQVAGLQLLGELAATEPTLTEAPITFTHLAAYPLLTVAAANPYLAELADDAERLQAERQSLLAEGERLLAEDLETYAAVNQALVIQPEDGWEAVVAKAISLRQLGRTAEAVAAFAKYAEMFAATDPTAERYAALARHFTMQMTTAGVVDGAVYLFAVEEGSRAARAGLQVEDIVIAVNEQPVHAVPDLEAILKAMPVGEPLTVTVLRLDERALFVRETITVVYEKPLGIGYMPI